MTAGNTYIIGDVHGCLNTLKFFIEKRLKLTKNDNLIFLGDLIDRGPDSYGVIQYFMKLKADGYNVISLLGNHEEMFIKSSEINRKFKPWFKKQLEQNPEFDYKKELENCTQLFKTFPVYICLENEGLILVHGSLNFNNKNIFQDEDAMIWGRQVDVDAAKLGNRKIIHGHTPATLREIELSLETNIVVLDGGCVYKGRNGLGYLVGLSVNNWQLYYQPNIEL